MCNLAFYTHLAFYMPPPLRQRRAVRANKPVTACKNTAYFSKNGEKL